MQYEQIKAERRGDVLLIVLDRPEKMNAWTPRMAEEQAHAIERANADPGIGAIVMTGSGRGFCAGADTQAVFQARIDGADPGNNTAGGTGGMPAGLDWVDLVRRSKPLVAAVNGPSIGVGLTMILPFDQIIASDAARFGTGFIRMGLVPELASSRWIVQRIGFGRASDLILSGRLIPASEAAQIGLADRLVPAASLVDEAVATARTYAANPDTQLRMAKSLLTMNSVETDLKLVQRREMQMLEECWKSPEHAEAVAAFREKRPPVFRPATAD